MIRLAYFLLTLAFAAPALGQSVGPRHKVTELPTNLLTAAALDSSKSFDLPDNIAEGYAILVLYFEFTRVAATRVDVTCSAKRRKTGGAPTTTLYVLQTCAVTAGVCTLDDAVGQKDVSGGSANWPIRFDILGHININCTVTSVIGGVTDVVTVKGTLVTE